MPLTFDTRCFNLAKELLGDIAGVTDQDIADLASDMQDAFETVASRIEGREPS